ncbi:MAG: sulfotransferase [Pseudomonadota bacterium]
MRAPPFLTKVYADNAARIEGRRNLARDLALHSMNSALRPLERVAVRVRPQRRPPIVLIVGAPRSGTTLLYQLMSRHLEVAYVTNFMARFWMAPVLGQWLNEVVLRGANPLAGELESAFGVTRGPLAPHEFSWLWRRWVDLEASDHLTRAELEAVDWRPLLDELEAMAAWSGRPLVLKALNHVDYHIEFLAARLPQARFVHIEREPRFVVQSILESRVGRYGDVGAWWSLRPRDWASWRSASPVDQVCHQVRDCLEHVRAGLATLPRERRLELSYEELVREPGSELRRLAGFVGCSLRHVHQLDSLQLRPSNRDRVDPETLAAIQTRIETW